MNTTRLVPVALLVLACLALVGSPTPAVAETEAARRDLVSTVIADGRFQVLAAAVNQAGLVPALRGDGPFTLFAPTDEAFAALPEADVAALLRPENRAQLQGLLKAHVVSGRVMAKALLPIAHVKTLAGATFDLGLRVGAANVIQADISATNGVIHVIDRVLMPAPKKAMTSKPALDASAVIHAAIEKGVPLYNAGDVKACAAVYHAAAQRLVASPGALSDLAHARFTRVIEHASEDASKHAWELRDAFDGALADMAFTPRLEASQPAGFPEPGPVGQVVRKSYPKYRAARAEGGDASFWTLFRHIKANNVEMTAPVEMTMDDDMQPRAMAFLYESADQGSTGTQGAVKVMDLDRVEVLSIGMRGRRTAEGLRMAKQLVEAKRKALGLHASGSYRALGYNSPMVPAANQYWELQVPVSTK